MKSQNIISDYENELYRPLLVALALRNKIYPIEHEDTINNNNIWAVPKGNYTDTCLSTLCLVCNELIISDDLIVSDHVDNVRYHGFLHLKNKGLLPFL